METIVWCVLSGFRSEPSKRHRGFSVNPLAMATTELEDLQRQSGLVGEDAAVFSFEEQSLKSWGAFLAVLGTVLTALYYLWLNPDTGYGECFWLIPSRKFMGCYFPVSSGRHLLVVTT